MNRKIFNYFEIAANLTQKKSDLDRREYLLGAIAVRGDGTMVASINGSNIEPNRNTHAEYRVCLKIDHGATIYVARIRLKDGAFALAKPCHSCQKMMKSKKVKKIYYTIGPKEYGIMYV